MGKRNPLRFSSWDHRGHLGIGNSKTSMIGNPHMSASGRPDGCDLCAYLGFLVGLFVRPANTPICESLRDDSAENQRRRFKAHALL